MGNRLARVQKLVELLREHPQTPLRDMAATLRVSDMTIRRDLAMLAENGIVETSSRGTTVKEGAGLFYTTDTRYSLAAAETRYRDEKIRIARRAAELIEPEDSIIIDAGSTTEYLARAIPESLECTVLCYTINSLVEIHKKAHCTVLFAGGLYHENTMMFESPEGLALIERSRANKAFISAAGISDRLGITCANQYEQETKRAAMASSVHKILLADSSKFDTIRSTFFATLADFDTVVTDTGVLAHYRDTMEEAGVELIVV